MSFSRNNEHFLRQEFYSPLRGLAAAEKELKYVGQSKLEARRRIRLYYEGIKDNIQNKITFYQELLEIFGHLEKQFLVYSIYFDPDSDALLAELGPIVLQYLDLTGEPLQLLFEQQMIPHDGSSTKGFLKQYFTGTLDLFTGEWEEEDGTRNPVTNKLTAWIGNALTSEMISKSLLEQVIVNYTKLWNIYFLDPFDHSKGLILIHKLFEKYKLIDPKRFRIDLGQCLLDLNNTFSDLLPFVCNSPLTDVENGSFYIEDRKNVVPQNAKAYLARASDFHKRLEQDRVFFTDLGNYSWAQLFEEYCTASSATMVAFQKEAEMRQNAGKAPSAKEISEFINKLTALRSTGKIDQRAVEKIAHENYIFFI